MMAIMSLPDIVIRSIRGKLEVNEVELVLKLMNSDKMREVIDRMVEERMWKIERELGKKLRGRLSESRSLSLTRL